jgi:hypothetical protein
VIRHREERSDAAIQTGAGLDCRAAKAARNDG